MEIPQNKEPVRFRTAQEELAYLRERVKAKEKEIGAESGTESARLAQREVRDYALTAPQQVVHEDVRISEHDALREALKLAPEEHDSKMDGLLSIVVNSGIRNALSVVANMNDPHVEDDFHRVLVQYVQHGFPAKNIPESGKMMRALHMTLYEVLPAQTSGGDKNESLEQLLKSTEQMYAGLLSLVRTGGTHDREACFSLEIATPQGKEDAVLYVAVPKQKKELFERQVLSIFPNVRLIETREDYNIFNYEGYHFVAHASQEKHPILPILTYKNFTHDPMNVVLSAFSKLKKYGEGAALQIIVGDEGDRYAKYYKKIASKIDEGKTLEQAAKTPETKLGTVLKEFGTELSGAFIGKKEEKEKKSAEEGLRSRVQEKLSSHIVPVSIRIVSSAGSESRAKEILENLASSFNQFEDVLGNRIAFTITKGRVERSEMSNFVMRMPEERYALPLSFTELTTLYHFTAEGVHTSRELKTNKAKQSPMPLDMPEEGIVLGTNAYGGSVNEVHFAPNDRMRHFYLVGQTGTGKSTLMKNMIIQDIERGEGVCFIDPHGSDIQDVLASVPPHREKDVIYFDPGYTARPMGLNMLEYDPRFPEQKTFLVDELISIFRKLYKDVPESIGPAFEQYFRNATLLVMEDPETGNTMVDITRIFADESFRALKLSRCKNPLVTQFWRDIASKTEGEQSLANFAQYVTNKFDVFLANEIMRPIVGQEESAFNMREVMDQKKILLINLAKGRLGEMNSSLLGLIIVGKILNAAFSRADSSAPLSPFYLYIDEFQNFTTPSIATILSEARKYRLILNMAHQFLDQLSPEIRDAVFGNVGTKCVFRVGEKDAEFLKDTMQPEFSAQDLINLDNFCGYIKMLANNRPVKAFNLETIPPKATDFSRLDALKANSYETYGTPREEVEESIRARYAGKTLSPEYLERL